MPRRLSKLIALWFVVQIVVPFTAPLQTLDLHDLFGGATHRSDRAAPESSTTPTIKEPAAAAALAPIVARLASAAASIASARTIERVSSVSRDRSPRASSSQHTVLRL
jgi:hypothetical protein